MRWYEVTVSTQQVALARKRGFCHRRAGSPESRVAWKMDFVTVQPASTTQRACLLERSRKPCRPFDARFTVFNGEHPGK